MTRTINVLHSQYDKGHTPEWVGVATPIEPLMAQYGLSEEDATFLLDGRSGQAGREAVRIHFEQMERCE